MQMSVDATELTAAANQLGGAGERFLEDLERIAYQRGQEGVTTIKEDFRTGGTTATRTAVRTGRLRDAYDAATERFNDGAAQGVDLRVGLIKPDVGDDVLLYGRVQEGYNFAGERVAQFIILPRASEYLHFKLPDGQWVMTKRVVLTPRPALPTIEATLPGKIAADIPAAFDRAMAGL